MKKKIQPETAWLFDVDGVLTSPEEKKIVQQGIFDELIKRLGRNEPVGFNTGRSIDFLVSEVLEPLEKLIDDKKMLRNIFAIGEKGAVWIVYDEKGERIIKIDEKITVPLEIKSRVRELIKQQKYAEIVFFDETKKTMVTLELRQNVTINDFNKIKHLLAIDIQNILLDLYKEGDFKVDQMRIAIDIESVEAGKALGARKFVELLSNEKIEPKRFVSFGDGTSDYDMFEELKNMGKVSQFVFVGERDCLKDRDLSGVSFTKKLVDEGTLEFLLKC